MQIDFHHAATYVVARLAGFNASEASIISYSSQYVDDAVDDSVIKFSNGAKFSRISTAHKMIDLNNVRDAENQRVWVPFHFLPGNNGLKADQKFVGRFIKKLVCKPDSFVAEDMIAKCIDDSEKPYALHRLGIAAHVLADTFSHQEFAGVSHDVNDVLKLDDGDDGKLDWLYDFFDKIKSSLINKALPLGHGAVLACPDLPYLRWNYQNGLHENIVKNNPVIFLEAVQSLFVSFKKYKAKNILSSITEKIPDKDLDQILLNVENFTDEDGMIRHKKWLKTIADGKFSFGKETVSYSAKGKNSWESQALKEEKDCRGYKYSDDFLLSNWKLFYDAAQKHSFEVVHEILPNYGICIA